MSLLDRARALVPRRLRRALRRFSNIGFKPYLIGIDLGDCRFSFWIADRVGQSWYRGTQSSSPEMVFTRGMVHQGDVVFEAGAHHGFMTLQLAQIVGLAGHIVAFEASPYNAEILRRNLAINNVANVTVEAQAVGASVRRTRISQDYNASVVVTGDAQREVGLTTFDTFAHLRPTVLKIDVEGYEVEVLRGSRAILATRPRLAIEVHVRELAQYGHTPDDVIAFIDPQWYELWLQPNGRSVPRPYHGEEIAADEQVHLYAVPRSAPGRGTAG